MRRQLEGGPLDYITMDFLAEITMSIMARARAADPSKGYATDFVTAAMAPNLERIAAQVGILATAVTLLMIAGEFDLSVGSMIGAAGMVIAIGMTEFALPPFLAVAVAFAFALAERGPVGAFGLIARAEAERLRAIAEAREREERRLAEVRHFAVCRIPSILASSSLSTRFTVTLPAPAKVKELSPSLLPELTVPATAMVTASMFSPSLSSMTRKSLYFGAFA